MIRKEALDYSTFLELIDSQEWLQSDIDEARYLTGFTIPQVFRKVNKNFIVIYAIYSDDVLLSIVTLDFANQLTYFNTVDVKSHLKSYLKFLKQLVEEYVKERSYLTVWSLKRYVTTTKKLKLLGFRQSKREFRRIKWVAQQKQ